MTAEVVVMNREAVAIAADSAGSIGPHKVFTSVSKIFCLSRSQPIGIMIYGSADFIGIPWDVIIKEFRDTSLKSKDYDLLDDYGENLISFLKRIIKTFSEDIVKDHLIYIIKSHFYNFLDEFQNVINDRIKEEEYLTDDDIKKILFEIIDQIYTRISKWNYKKGLSVAFEKKVEQKYKKTIADTINEIFTNFNLDQDRLKKLIKISICVLLKIQKDSSTFYDSGIVIVGYGKKEYFPSLFNVKISGVVLNKLLYSEKEISKISHKRGAIIAPFAQAYNEIHTFIEGINPQLLSNYYQIIRGLAEYIQKKVSSKDDKITSSKDLLKELDDYRKRVYVDQILGAVVWLPKSELASFAESLVNLTSIKMRYMSLSQETVGGPIDVALISKNDGFIWIKRKHYFKPELNPQFFVRYRK